MHKNEPDAITSKATNSPDAAAACLRATTL